MAAIMREKSGRRRKGANRSANFAVQRVGAAAALLLQFGNVLQRKFALAVRLRHELRLDFGPFARDFHHVLLRHLADRCLGSHLLTNNKKLLISSQLTSLLVCSQIGILSEDSIFSTENSYS